MSLLHRLTVGKAVLWASLMASAVELRAQVVVRQDFDGPGTTWREGRTGSGYRKTVHERTSQGARTGSACEYLQFDAGAGGTFVYLTHDLAPARVITELKPTLWIRSDRQGIQLLARVVFPRSINPENAQPDTVLIAGTSYGRVGNWEQLRLEDVPKLAAAQARVVSAETKRYVDVREAYLDRLVLNIYSGSGPTRLWIDDLEVAGFVGEAAVSGTQLPPPAAATRQPTPRTELASSRASGPRPEVPQMSGAVLLLNNRPLFPRAIEYQGEPLGFLKQLGFNAIRLRTLPTSETLSQARELGLWVICAPPMPAGLDGPSAPGAAPLAEIPPEFDCVLAWDLGEGLTGRELDAVKRWAEQVRRADRLSRPIVCGASAELRAYSAPGRADILVLDRFTPSTTFELADYRRWLHERPRFARHGTPVWSTVPTEPATSLVRQVAGLSGGKPVSILAGMEQTRLVAYTALGSGARALIFASHAPLTAEDGDTRWRAMQLELLNLELQLIEPWIAGGKLVTTVTSIDKDIQAAVLQIGGAHMVLPVWSGKGAQYVPGHHAGSGTLSFVVPGVPETVGAYEIWPGGMRALLPVRVTGGVSVTVDDFGLTSMILLTQDLGGEMLQRTRAGGDRATKLAIETARVKLQVDSEVRSRLPGKEKALARGDELLKNAQKELQAAEAELTAGNVGEGFRRAQFALRNLRAMERNYWQVAVAKLAAPVSDPYAVTFSTLPQHFALVANMDSSRRMANLLPTGNFEDELGRIMNLGWKFYIHRRSPPDPDSPEDVRAEAKLSRDKHCEGKYSLHLAATAIDPEAPPEQIETPPGWITTPEMTVEPGMLLRLHGRVLVPTPIKGSPDGLLIIDSLGGEPLADRIVHAPEWKEFTAYRVADGSRTLSITFALSGLGEVWIDDLTVEPIAPRDPAARPPNRLLDPAALRRLPLFR